MIKKMIQLIQLSLLTVVLPLLCGCISGDGGSQSSDLFSSGGGSTSGGIGGDIGNGAPGSLSTIHNPEPTTMLLLGSGALAMAYYKNMISRKP